MLVTSIIDTKKSTSSGTEGSIVLNDDTRRVVVWSNTTNVELRFSAGGTGAVIPTDERYILENPALGGQTLYFYHATSGTMYVLEQLLAMS